MKHPNHHDEMELKDEHCEEQQTITNSKIISLFTSKAEGSCKTILSI